MSVGRMSPKGQRVAVRISGCGFPGAIAPHSTTLNWHHRKIGVFEMSDAAAIATIIQATRTQESALLLMDGAASIFHCFDRPTEKAIVFFHGFTAIPAQFDAIATVFHA
ncbi:MAG: hypothetical protein HC895_26320, partial [Leptolyngbyaceae cyanobacterium SM1_3_5]|nr:hypothetical protein [Leptolyngbyaceae cyanobacterium SM1_3_5]